MIVPGDWLALVRTAGLADSHGAASLVGDNAPGARDVRRPSISRRRFCSQPCWRDKRPRKAGRHA